MSQFSQTGAGVGVKERMYAPEQVVCVRCTHVREMVGETEEVLRRTRDAASENAVLNAVRRGGCEPDWFVERWVEDGKGSGELVACAVFEEAVKAKGFKEAVEAWAKELEKREGASPVNIRNDPALAESVARHFTEEWKRIRVEQMGKYGTVLADAREKGMYAGRIVVGEYVAEDEDAKKAFEELRGKLEEIGGADEARIAYAGYWDEGKVARFCFGFSEREMCLDALEMLDGIGARFYDPLKEEANGVELEMAALVIAQMQKEEMERKAAQEIAAQAAKEVKLALEEKIGEKAVAAREAMRIVGG